MATPTLTPVATNRTTGVGGTDLSAAAVAANVAGDTWANTGREMVYIENGSGSPITLTMVLAATATIDGIATTSRTLSLVAAKRYVLGPFPPGAYNDVNGFMNLTYSGVTSLKVLVFYLGN